MADQELTLKVKADTSEATEGVKLMKTEVREAARIVARSKSDFERYGDQLERINELEERQALTSAEANKARRHIQFNRFTGGFGNVLGAFGFSAKSLTLFGAATAVATRALQDFRMTLNEVRSLAERERATGLPAAFIEAARITGGDAVTPQTTQAFLEAIDRFSLEQGISARQAELRLRSIFEGRAPREQRLIARELGIGSDASITELIRRGPFDLRAGRAAQEAVDTRNFFMRNIGQPYMDFRRQRWMELMSFDVTNAIPVLQMQNLITSRLRDESIFDIMPITAVPRAVWRLFNGTEENPGLVDDFTVDTL